MRGKDPADGSGGRGLQYLDVVRIRRTRIDDGPFIPGSAADQVTVGACARHGTPIVRRHANQSVHQTYHTSGLQVAVGLARIFRVDQTHLGPGAVIGQYGLSAVTKSREARHNHCDRPWRVRPRHERCDIPEARDVRQHLARGIHELEA